MRPLETALDSDWLHLQGIARTLSARYYKDGSEILISQGSRKNPRRLTPRECALLMGFPPNFKIPVSDTQAYRQFGNSVVVPVMRKMRTLFVLPCRERLENLPISCLSAITIITQRSLRFGGGFDTRSAKLPSRWADFPSTRCATISGAASQV